MNKSISIIWCSSFEGSGSSLEQSIIDGLDLVFDDLGKRCLLKHDQELVVFDVSYRVAEDGLADHVDEPVLGNTDSSLITENLEILLEQGLADAIGRLQNHHPAFLFHYHMIVSHQRSHIYAIVRELAFPHNHVPVHSCPSVPSPGQKP